MKPKIEIFLGDPINDEGENAFLARICPDLEAREEDIIIFANFITPDALRQINFLVGDQNINAF